jgi:plasmid maintenance system antidote protein VapI
MTSKLHIGKIISEQLAEKNISNRDIAKQLDIPESIFSLMLKNHDLGCNILFKISKILDHDFFQYYSNYLTYPNPSKNGFDKVEKKIVI